jgi:hypothetical protein
MLPKIGFFRQGDKRVVEIRQVGAEKGTLNGGDLI